MQDRTGAGRQKTSHESTPNGKGPPPAIRIILDTRRERSDAITVQNDELEKKTR